ncbi:DUF7933 domain-containing protein [Deinococcus sp. UYEF24]
MKRDIGRGLKAVRERLRLGAATLGLTTLGLTTLGLLGLTTPGTAQATNGSGGTGTVCTAVYGTRINGSDASLVYYDVNANTYATLTRTPTDRPNGAAIDPVSGKIFYIDQSNNGLYAYDPVAKTFGSALGTVQAPRPGDNGPIVIGATFTPGGNLYALYTSRSGGRTYVGQINPANGALIGNYNELKYQNSGVFSEVTNGDIAINGGNTYAVVEPGGVPTFYSLDFATGTLTNPVPLRLNGSTLNSRSVTVNGLAYNPVVGRYYVNLSGSSEGLYLLDPASGTLSSPGGAGSYSGITDLASCAAKPDLPTLSKSFSPVSAVGAPARTTLTLNIGNTNTAPYYLIKALTDAFPSASAAQMVLASPAAVTGSCVANGGSTRGNAALVTASAGDNKLTLASGFTVPAGGCTLSVPVTVPATGVYTNTISAGALMTTAGNNAAATSATFTVQAAPPPDSGTCTAGTPYLQSFNGPNAALAEVRNHTYLSSPNTVTGTDGTYTLWDQIDHSGNGGYALFYNIANFENKNGGTLSTPGLLYESQITVPAGAPISYQNYVRSHSASATQLQYRFYDGVSGTLLKSTDGPLVGTDYSKQTVPTFTSPSNKVILRIYTLKDGTTADTNVLKLDDLSLSCGTASVPSSLSVVKTHSPATFQAAEQGTYTLNVSNLASSGAPRLATTGTITVIDTLPASVGVAPASGFQVTSGGLTWTCTYPDETVNGYKTSGQTVTCTTPGSLAAGASSQISFLVTVLPDASGTIVNTAAVSGGGDPFNGGKPASGAACDATHCSTDTAPVTALPTPPTVCTSGTTTNLLATPNFTGYSDRDNGTDSYPATLIGNAVNYRQGLGNGGAFILDLDWWYNNGVSGLSQASTLSLYVNGTEYSRITSTDGYGGAANLVGLNGASVSAGWLNRGYYRGLYPKVRSFLILPLSVTQVSSVELRFTGGLTTGVSDDYGFNLRAINACAKPVAKVSASKTVQNITAGTPVGVSSSGKPGEVLEYCIVTQSIGNANVTKLAFSDNVPSNTNAQSGAYGAGKDIQVVLPSGTSYATFAADGDAGQLSAGAVSVNLPTLTLTPGQSFTVCFRATIG